MRRVLSGSQKEKILNGFCLESDFSLEVGFGTSFCSDFNFSFCSGSDIDFNFSFWLKKAEYMEHWVYELAKMYHKVGNVEKCVKECEDLILWFGQDLFLAQNLN